jgi:hypothetical protein
MRRWPISYDMASENLATCAPHVTALVFSLFRACLHPFGDFWFAEATGRLQNTSILALIGYYMVLS